MEGFAWILTNVNPIMVAVSRSALTLQAPSAVVVGLDTLPMEGLVWILMNVKPIMEGVIKCVPTLMDPLPAPATPGSV